MGDKVRFAQRKQPECDAVFFRNSLGVVEDDSEGETVAGADGADSMAHGYSIHTTGTVLRAMVDGEDDSLALMERDDRGPGLHARALFGEDELASSEVASRLAEEEGDLKREDELAIEVLMETVVVLLLVLEKQWSGASLASVVAELENFSVL